MRRTMELPEAKGCAIQTDDNGYLKISWFQAALAAAPLVISAASALKGSGASPEPKPKTTLPGPTGN
jgi:hypothetical protein